MFFFQGGFVQLGTVLHFKRWAFYFSSDTFNSDENIDEINLWKKCDDCQQF